MVVPAAWRPAVKSLGLAVPLALLVAKDLAQAPRVLMTLRGLRAQRAGLLQYLAACLPPALLGMARLDRVMWGGFVRWLRRQPNPARPAGLKLGFSDRSAYSAMVAFGLVSLIVELPICALILPLLIHDPAAVRTIHLLSGLGAAYSVVWLLGDRWLLRGAHHVLSETCLDLQIGARASARIPLASIEDVRLLRESAEQWRKKHGLRHADTVSITPFDKPNLVVCLTPDVHCEITHHGLARDAVRYVFLYLDHPTQLLNAFAKRRVRE
jgi:hypothetical protein